MKSRIALCCAGLLLLTGLSAAPSRKPGKTITVKITKKGFEPKELSLPRGVPVRLIFIRQTAQTCGTEVTFPTYHITKPLPLHKPVSIEFTPTEEGTLNFTCGMDMLRGKVVVQ
ncbi:MAG: cupredoxin domain-containing protein [Blastocatellia bacterium]